MNRIDSIKFSINIFDLLDKLRIDYGSHRSSHNIECPFHQEINPSMRIYPDTNKLYCYVCNRVWDVIDVVVDYMNLNFQDALSWLEHEFNIDYQGSAKARFYRKSKMRRKTGAKTKAEEQFQRFYWSLNKFFGDFTWKRIFYCYEVFDEISDMDYKNAIFWVDNSKKIVLNSLATEHSMKMI